jgi:AP-1-like transcription factor
MPNQNSQFYLSPGQKDLMAALSSNQQPGQPKHVASGASQRTGNCALGLQRFSASGTTEEAYLNPASMIIPNSGELDFAPDESPYLDFDIDGDGDDNFDFDAGDDMIGEMPRSGNGHELHEKRKSIDGKNHDGEGGGKRQEGEDKSGKKPGRKPLASEPTTVSALT